MIPALIAHHSLPQPHALTLPSPWCASPTVLDHSEGKSWPEKVEAMTEDDLVAVGRKFCEMSVDQLKHRAWAPALAPLVTE